MKKALSMLLAGIMLLSLCACGKEDTTSEPDTAETIVSIMESDDVVVKGSEDAFPENTIVKAEKVSEGDKFITADTALKETATKFQLYDITAMSDNVAVQPNGTVKATFDIPADFDTDKVAVVYISDDGKVETLASTVDVASKTVTAELSHFSLYAVIETIDTDNPESNTTESTDNTSKTESTTDSNSSQTSKPSSSSKKCSDADHSRQLAQGINTCSVCGKSLKQQSSSKPSTSTPSETECKHNVKYTFDNIPNTWSHTGECTLCKTPFENNVACADANKDNKCDACSAKMDFGTAYKNKGFVIEWVGLNYSDTRYDETPLLTAETVFMETKFKTTEIDVKFTEFSEIYTYSASDFEKMAKSLFNIDNAKITEMRALQQRRDGTMVSLYDSATNTYSYSQGAFGGGNPPDYLGYKKISDTEYAVYINDTSYDYVKVINCTYTDTVKISSIYAISSAPSDLTKFG